MKNKEKPVITKEEFCNILNRFKALSDLDDKVYSFCREINMQTGQNFQYANIMENSNIDTVLFLLEKIMRVKPDAAIDSTIEYFVYDLDFGRKYEDGKITEIEKDGTTENVKLSTAEELYNFLVRVYWDDVVD